jgi:hypothetical protein
MKMLSAKAKISALAGCEMISKIKNPQKNLP